ncbi:rhomboid family intramembrane serine protease [Candidatus Solincola sp.]|nr:rhomboid family intramembrane serine protease [Actinomycetota bacterium]MDI7251928.1 rhomboid family intramembrane serine protease [Actinomycetota bacterium]
MLPLFDRNPARRTPTVVIALILANLAVFLYMLFLRGAQLEIFTYRYSVVPWEIVHASRLPLGVLRELFSYPPATVPAKQVYLPLLTSMFLHEGWLHILGNMLYLWIFGNNVEDVMGHLPFLLFYLICGLFGTLLHVAVFPNSVALLLGASGAIAGVLGAYLLLYPRAWIYTLFMFFIVPIPAFVVIGFWIVLQFFGGLSSIAGGMSAGTAWFAHLGGASMGMIITGIFYPLLRRRREELLMMPRRSWWQ